MIGHLDFTSACAVFAAEHRLSVNEVIDLCECGICQHVHSVLHGHWIVFDPKVPDVQTAMAASATIMALDSRNLSDEWFKRPLIAVDPGMDEPKLPRPRKRLG